MASSSNPASVFKFGSLIFGQMHFCSTVLLFTNIIRRVPDENGIFQACCIVEIYHSGPEASIISPLYMQYVQPCFESV